jgi:hypothetical protein
MRANSWRDNKLFSKVTPMKIWHGILSVVLYSYASGIQYTLCTVNLLCIVVVVPYSFYSQGGRHLREYFRN